ncbi:hypothetical protein MA16_Dca001797 [Dendrobium catenatum]|uniref:Uncharacterized protein n=1 Tax=Dendrobium catenatum TaxID=906689 RepID=A0A2I0XDH9_9ASPA|nr:hypothetical protein MA16_Dca001797 [Dendrobium catenatum]
MAIEIRIKVRWLHCPSIASTTAALFCPLFMGFQRMITSGFCLAYRRCVKQEKD